MIFHVSESWVDLRSTPSSSRVNLITGLPFGHEVRFIREQNNWWLIGTFYQQGYIEAYVLPGHLKQGTSNILDVPTPEIPQARLPNDEFVISPSSLMHEYEINHPKRPKRILTSSKSRVNGIFEILEYLDVEHSVRYASNGSNTYCNIYAHDFAHLGGVYLPRVWWSDKALSSLAASESVFTRYEVTVNEMGADRLYDWLYNWGASFGWTKLFDLDEVQNAANSGHICLLSAKRKQSNAPGHICLVLPESSQCSALRNSGKVTLPVMSQAGKTNRKFFTHRWWTHIQFSFFGFWVAT